MVPAPDSVSLTLDIGHLELAGLESVMFIQNMPQPLVERTRFVHLHHHDKEGGQAVSDHKPFVPGCRELAALRELLKRKN